MPLVIPTVAYSKPPSPSSCQTADVTKAITKNLVGRRVISLPASCCWCKQIDRDGSISRGNIGINCSKLSTLFQFVICILFTDNLFL